jgi:TolA-binding protein
MGQPERSLSDLGRRVAREQDRAPEARLDRDRGRARLLDADLSPARRARVPRFLVPLAAAIAIAALLVLVLRPRRALRFAIDGGPATSALDGGAWIAAPAERELPIRFSDGSVLRLAPAGRARVASVNADGAEIALERGSLDLAVVHRDSTRWLVRVGPFQVRVVGTRFETSWDPVSERFGVALREGAIVVSGPILGESRAIRAGERLTVSIATGTMEVSSATQPITVAPSATAAAAPATAAPIDIATLPDEPAPKPGPAIAPSTSASTAAIRAPEAEPRSSAKPADPAPSDAPGWRSLALDAKYKDALAAAEREGFDSIVASAGVADLYALGDAARLGGSGARASQAFTALRARFPGSPEAASAAFLLGRMAQDQRRDHAAAAAFFARYLSEQPGGAFAADAMGRLVEAHDKLGDRASARRAAERYLAVFPNGSHAAYAKRVLAGAETPAP